MNVLQTQRLSIATVFFLNGFGFSSLMSRLPEIKSQYDMNNAVLGQVLFCRAAGALLAMPFAGWLGSRWSSNRLTWSMTQLMLVLLPILLLMPNIWLFSILFFLLGASEGILDVNMNEQAVLIERGYGKPIMSSFHAVFSAGMALGAASGAAMSYYQVPLWQHYALFGLAGTLLLYLASQYFVTAEKTVIEADKPMFLLPTKAVLPLGIIAFCCMTGEGTMADWSAVFMKQVLQQPESFAAAALAAFNAAMFVGRAGGDWLNHRIGQQKLLMVDSVAAVAGLSLVLLATAPWLALAGFFIIGLGLSTIVPIVYSAAGNVPGVSPSNGIAMATSIGYAGFFVGPPVIGYLAEGFGLRIGLVFTLVLFLAMTALIKRMR